jgi:hypothetical protein
MGLRESANRVRPTTERIPFSLLLGLLIPHPLTDPTIAAFVATTINDNEPTEPPSATVEIDTSPKAATNEDEREHEGGWGARGEGGGLIDF